MKNVQMALLGGFLGAGKTTTMIRTAEVLQSRGLQVAIITNDQGKELIDTELSKKSGLNTREVTGGCFCCRFEELYDHLHALAEHERPDVIICEAVGSCTDLAATVLQPLQRYYAHEFTTVPLTVVVDPARLLLELDGKRDTPLFSQSVSYIFEKQLAEADIIALNKLDQYSAEEMVRLGNYLAKRYPNAVIQPISAGRGDNLDKLIHLWSTLESGGTNILEIDYEQYAEGEAQLAWMNLMGDLQRTDGKPLDPEEWIAGFLAQLNNHFVRERMAVAHLKVHAGNDTGFVKASVVQTGMAPVYTRDAGLVLGAGYRVVLNIRIEASPALLDLVVADAIASVNHDMSSAWLQTYHECFSPLPPQPTHRLKITS
ncbi:GTP-binding protein [Paenibacillus tarimensis]|uniref:GTP-binding protein n=1 Tax=Paenibacillus tarimensis TaxID=416012 RepID=UPI001F470CBA|nr:GTP-binding protein [Paenibacillus tarimensis]MCF2945280.1 cobalamin biosynthesis protein [Paenibacillus tarimensis]